MPAGDEHHVGAFEHRLDALAILQRGLAADLGIRAGAETLGHVATQLQVGARAAAGHGLRIGVGDDEFHAFDVGIEHVRDGIAAAAAHADDLDDRIGCESYRSVQTFPVLRRVVVVVTMQRDSCRFMVVG